MWKFILKEDKQNKLIKLANNQHPDMNWIKNGTSWGEIICPEHLRCTISRTLNEKGNLEEHYRFYNDGSFPIATTRKSIGICTPFNDNYENANVCLKEKCHTHIYCGGESAWIMALQMGGQGPNLGLRLINGSIHAYSIQRNIEEQSNDRGIFILHPDLPILNPGEDYELIWELFWFSDNSDFLNYLKGLSDFPVVQSSKFLYFEGEKIQYSVYENGEERKKQFIADSSGELFLSEGSNKHASIRFLIQPDFWELTRRRCEFICHKQQYHKHGSSLDGAYLIYDNEEQKQYYSHKDDQNGGRERIGMGILLARYLQKIKDPELLDSLSSYTNYVYRELYDKNSGIVYNDIQKNLDWHRLYNYPWVALFQLELYRLTGIQSYIQDSVQTMNRYYTEGGTEFYGIAIAATDLLSELEKTNLIKETQCFKKHFLRHAETLLKNSLNYPPFEVKYEQSIVAPAVDCLLQAYEIFGEERFLNEAKRQLKILEYFNGIQPDYHQYEVSIRHWDGYWFGKRQQYGDTYPHYWSSLTGLVYARYYKICGNQEYKQKAVASLRASLSLIFADGSASCAMVFPYMVNRKAAHTYDPWANDQDWALYFALLYSDLLLEENNH